MEGVIKKMDSVQRKAAIQATGAMRTTLTDLLLAHANMFLIKELIRKIYNTVALQMATLPKTHPLYKDIKAMKSK